MSVKKMNEKLEKLLKDLDKAINDRDLAKVEKAMKEAQDFNKKSEGEIYEIPIRTSSSEQKSDEQKSGEQQETGVLRERIYEYLNKQLEQRIQKIAEELHPSQELDDQEKNELADIRKKLIDQKTSFEKMEKVIETLSRNESTNQEDLKQYKEQQKEENLIRINLQKEKAEKFTEKMMYIETTYLNPIEKHKEIREIIEQIFDKKSFIEKIQGTGVDEIVNDTMLEIDDLLSKLSSKGIDVSKCNTQALSFNALSTVKKDAINSIGDLISAIQKDSNLSSEWRNQFKGIQGDINLKSTYKKFVRERQELVTEIAKLQAENKQIDKTIQILEREENYKNVAYNEDGTLKTDSEIARAVLSSQEGKEYVEQSIDIRKFDSKSLFKKFGAKRNYYKRALNYEKGFLNSIKIFFKSFFGNTQDIKMLARESMATYLGKQYADNARDGMKRRQDKFKEAIKNAAAKEVSINSKAKQADIRDDIRKEAYKSALEETTAENRERDEI